MTLKRTLPTIALALALALVAAACGEKYSAERDGKKLGEAICDLRDADSEEDAQEALDDINEQLDDLGSKHSMYTAEDRADIQNNLSATSPRRSTDARALRTALMSRNSSGGVLPSDHA